ncbi:MAG: hypothetical protein GYA23_05220 [Methanomicrobiales archaeon]|nr:hypothetical protein [Methanomicrobiales archaeon]
MDTTGPHPGPGLPAGNPGTTGNPAIPPPAPAATGRHGRRWLIAGAVIVLLIIIAAALIIFGIIRLGPEPIVGTWSIGETSVRMVCDPDGTATLRYPDTGDYAVGRWERIGEDTYQFSSGKAGTKIVVIYDPISDVLHTKDFSVIFVRVR